MTSLQPKIPVSISQFSSTKAQDYYVNLRKLSNSNWIIMILTCDGKHFAFLMCHSASDLNVGRH